MEQSATDQQAPDAMLVQPTHLRQMVDDLFETMLDLEVFESPCPDSSIPSRYLQASVRIEGDWNAELMVFASPELAAVVASAMFGSEASALDDEEVFDALGEVANVIGGNVKGIVDGDCCLSLPCVGLGRDRPVYAQSIQSFRCCGDDFHLVLNQN